MFFPLQADEFLLFNAVNPNLDKTGTKKYWVKRHKHTKYKFKIIKRLGNSTTFRIRKLNLNIRQIPGLQNEGATGALISWN